MNAKKHSFSHRLALPMAALAIVLLAAAGAAALEPQPESPVTSGLTYQGRLASDGGRQVDDTCGFQFTLWDDPAAGSQVGPVLNAAELFIGLEPGQSGIHPELTLFYIRP